MRYLITGILLILSCASFSQSLKKQQLLSSYWQQKVNYVMNIDVDANKNQFSGKQKLEYWNNSTDSLTRVFYHLQWNAFQPGSMMDERSRRQGTIQKPGAAGPDWDGRVKDRIQNLKPDEIGYQKIISLKMNGRAQQFKVQETILEVRLDKPIAPATKVVFEMEFQAQVPLQIRRSGRNNAEGVRFSMSQWYPKICEYDETGWHPTPYVAREFYGVWGDFEVNISIDKSYVLAGTGYLQNPNQIGYGYEAKGAKVERPAGEKLTWKFIAPMVHDFVWAADPEYKHETRTVRDGLVLHAFYKIDNEKLKAQYDALAVSQKKIYGNNPYLFIEKYKRDWETALDLAEKALPFIDKTFGKYPYKQYSFIQGGDGGMEYPMATLLKGAGEETVIHEWMHSWYQGLLGTDETHHPWMDEGFTTYAENRVLKYLYNDTSFEHSGAYKAYAQLVKSNLEEPLTTPGDFFNSNYAYSVGSYVKGCIFLSQLGYIVSDQTMDKILFSYYKNWIYKHPSVDDFIKIAEKESNMKLDWYKDYWVSSTKTIDYGIDSLWEEGGKTKIRINKVGLMPMPIDVQVAFKDGSTEMHYVPLNIMFGEKQPDNSTRKQKTYTAWKWTTPSYIIETDRKLFDIKVVEIDPSLRMADIERKNNKLDLSGVVTNGL